ncbi:MAG TPA: SCO family protein [Verrucomicrobiae bacterium]|nr:SCO family protein [Verrucomicrobiae bacterium]
MITKSLIITVVLLSLPLGIAAAGETNLVCRSCCMAELPATRFTDKSLYQVQSAWTTDGQKEINLGALAGRPQIVLMFFSRCTTACPVLVNDLRKIESALPAETRQKIGFTLVSFDSEHDTAPVLAEYRKEWNLPGNWTLLTGAADDVRELAALLGIQYKETAGGQFAHSNVITLLNAEGEIVFQQGGLDQDIGPMVQRIEQQLK